MITFLLESYCSFCKGHKERCHTFLYMCALIFPQSYEVYNDLCHTYGVHWSSLRVVMKYTMICAIHMGYIDLPSELWSIQWSVPYICVHWSSLRVVMKYTMICAIHMCALILSQEHVSVQSGCQNCRVGSVARIPRDQRLSGILATDPTRLFWQPDWPQTCSLFYLMLYFKYSILGVYTLL